MKTDDKKNKDLSDRFKKLDKENCDKHNSHILIQNSSHLSVPKFKLDAVKKDCTTYRTDKLQELEVKRSLSSQD